MYQPSSMARFCPNVLLARADIGNSKPTSRLLPPKDWCYGRDFGRDNEGAGQVTLSWKFHKQSPGRKSKTDFTKLNKMCIQQKLSSAKAYANFRSNNNARMSLKKGNTSVPIFIPEEAFRYGIRNRPPTPVERVLSNDYQRQSMFMRQQLQQQRKPTKSARRQRILPIINKSTFLYAEAAKARRAAVENNFNKIQYKLYKMPKYRNIQRKIYTQRKRYTSVPPVVKNPVPTGQ